MIVNTGDEAYSGAINFPEGHNYVELDPQTGTISESKKMATRSTSVRLIPLQTKLFVIL
jgi:hypothetical protein